MGAEKIKQVIVMRKDLNMRKGKMVAQGAHASLNAILNCQKAYDWVNQVMILKFDDTIESWIDGLKTKICVSVNSEQELFEVVNGATDRDIPYSLIEDAGLTEFDGEPTFTCCALGPAKADLIDEVTGKLPLL